MKSNRGDGCIGHGRVLPGAARRVSLDTMVAMGGALVLVMAAFPAEAGADAADGSSAGGSSANGPISEAIDDFGQSLCPQLVKPASDLATAVSEIQGNSGLTPAMTGMVTGIAVQLECPAFMTSLANGKLPATSPVATAQQSGGSHAGAPLLQIPGLTVPPTRAGDK